MDQDFVAFPPDASSALRRPGCNRRHCGGARHRVSARPQHHSQSDITAAAGRASPAVLGRVPLGEAALALLSSVLCVA